MIVSEFRRYMEAAIGGLSPARARELAALLTGESAEQVSKAGRDLLEWSNRSRERLSQLIRTEVRSQVKQLGLASRDEVDALRKRVRELERSKRPAKKSGAKRSAKPPARAAASTASA
jgi:hypothetical protein